MPEVDPANLTFITANHWNASLANLLLRQRNALGVFDHIDVDDVMTSMEDLSDTDYDIVRDHNVIRNNLSTSCPFVVNNEQTMVIDYVYHIPIMLLLACNAIFLIWIMKVTIICNNSYRLFFVRLAKNSDRKKN